MAAAQTNNAKSMQQAQAQLAAAQASVTATKTNNQKSLQQAEAQVNRGPHDPFPGRVPVGQRPGGRGRRHDRRRREPDLHLPAPGGADHRPRPGTVRHRRPTEHPPVRERDAVAGLHARDVAGA